ncbi:hypothetical protein ACFWHQ_40730 [Streptomyces sp. NPDC060334]|uniref:hypothetical protein n=1 Tax=Streptomyces sp. NPDC060334 TaxID=3347099 RepID=UPI003648E175
MNLNDRTSIRWLGGGSDSWPDHAGRRHAVMALMVGGLLGSMVLLITIGIPDALGALNFASRLSGFMFVVAGLVQCVAALTALDYWGKRELRYSGAVVLVGVFIAFAIYAILLIVWLDETEFTPYTLGFIPLWCWSLWAIWLLARERVWQGIPHPKGFAIGVTITTLLAATNLAHSAVYKPTSNAMVIHLNVSFGTPTLDHKRSIVHLPVTLHAKNPGSVGAYITSDRYVVQGRSARYSETSKTLIDWKKAITTNDVARFVGPPELTTISTGPFSGAGTWLEPSEEFRSMKVVQIPANAQYDSIEGHIYMNVMRRDRAKADENEFVKVHYSWDPKPGDKFCPAKGCSSEYAAHHAQLRHTSNIINVTHKPRYILARWWANKTSSSFDTYVTTYDFRRELDINKFGSEGEVGLRKGGEAERLELKEKEQDRYGMMSVSTIAAVPFAGMLEPRHE